MIVKIRFSNQGTPGGGQYPGTIPRTNHQITKRKRQIPLGIRQEREITCSAIPITRQYQEGTGEEETHQYRTRLHREHFLEVTTPHAAQGPDTSPPAAPRSCWLPLGDIG